MKKAIFASAAAILVFLVISACQVPFGTGGQSGAGKAPPRSVATDGASTGSTPLSGAIFTTLVDGTRVNANLYEAKEDVYLDGGPGPNAPASAAGLPEGDYYFQVTDPSGKDLLSTDHISARKIHVNGEGVISEVYQGSGFKKNQGTWELVTAQHNQGVDTDHAELGAITVQLFPYDDTPNMGGVYKVWITRVEDYAAPDSYEYADQFVDWLNSANGKPAVNGEDYSPGYYHGFIPALSKTDNFKVEKKGKPYESPEVTVRKFHDANLNGIWDAGEEELAWAVRVLDPLGTSPTTVYTPATIIAEPAGSWSFTENTPAGTMQTVSLLDGNQLSAYPSAEPTVELTVAGTSGETHEVVYGNVGLGQLTALKIYDQNANGIADAGEPPVAGWHFQLSGTVVTGEPVGPTVQTTGTDGTTVFAGLLPGTYTVTEIIPPGGQWQTTGPLSQELTVESTLSGDSITGSQLVATFANFCVGTADFDTKGYWHNKNGLSKLTAGDIEDVNNLLPYAVASTYFDNGDEPFDGHYSDGTPVDAVNGEWGEEIAPAGTANAEVSHFLVDPNAGGDPREQLAQQLLAFVFNCIHRLDNPNAAIQLPDGSWTTASALIVMAVEAWDTGTAAEQGDLQSLLDTLNNGDAMPFVHYSPCPVVY